MIATAEALGVKRIAVKRASQETETHLTCPRCEGQVDALISARPDDPVLVCERCAIREREDS